MFSQMGIYGHKIDHPTIIQLTLIFPLYLSIQRSTTPTTVSFFLCNLISRRRREEEEERFLFLFIKNKKNKKKERKGGFDVLLGTPSTVHFFLLMYDSMGKKVGEIMKGTFGKSLLMGLNKTLAKLHSSLYYQCGGRKKPKIQKPQKTKNKKPKRKGPQAIYFWDLELASFHTFKICF